MRRLLLPALAGVLMLTCVPGSPRAVIAAPGEPLAGAGADSAAADLRNELSPELRARLARAELLAGLTPVEGPGLTISLRHSSRKPPRGADRNNFLLHDRDVNFILNGLRAAGAEALAISGAGSESAQRITTSSVVVETRAGFQVNGTEIKVPLQILAIGDAARLRAELLRRDGAIKTAGLDVLQMVQLADTPLLRIPAAKHVGEFRFARVPDAGAHATLAENPPSVPGPAVSADPLPANPASLLPPVPTRVPMPPATARKGDKTPAPSQPPVASAVPRESAPAVPGPATIRSETPGRPLSGEPVAVAPAGMPPRREPEVVAVIPRASKAAPPKQAPVEPQATRPPVSGPVFGGKGLAKYHVAGCRFGERIGRQERVTYVSPEEARKSGRKPCSICCADRP